ncbi:MAG: HAMP domain-containing protein, partial [Desulfuromonadales bacterium]|nr:HAMP domain-containing protein [Desulfuromonadales bacterium]
MTQLSFHRKVLYVFCGLSLLPLMLLAFFATKSLDTVEEMLRTSAIEALDEQAAKTLELRAVMVANEVSSFLRQVESDLDALMHLPVEQESYLWFSHSHRRPIWVRAGTNDAPSEARLSVPLYSEIAYIGADGVERLRVVENKPSDALRDVSLPGNTTYLTETYFSSAKNLPPEQLHVSHVTGWHVSKEEQLAGAATPAEAIEGGEYHGVVRFARPKHNADGVLIGVVVLSLDHRHLMEFTQHITPTDERYVVFPSYQSGNYAFMFDDEGWIITHPKLWDIRGLDRTGHLLPPYTEHSTPEEVEWGPPYNLSKAAFVHKNYPLAHQAVLGGRSGVVDVTNVGGSRKIMAYAPIFYDSGPYAEFGVFGGITIGAEIKQFHMVADAVSIDIEQLYIRFLTGAWILIGLTFILVVAVAYRLSHTITAPLSRLISGTKQMARGKLATPVEIESPVEVAELATAFNSLSRQLYERRERLLKMLSVLRQSRQEIQQERDFNQTIVENVEAGIMTLDEQGQVTSLNGPARRTLGVSIVDEAMSLTRLLSEWPELDAAVSDAFELEHWSEYVTVDRAGRSLTFRLALHPLQSGRGKGRLLTIEDLTERVSFRQQLARFERLASLGRLSAGIAHEV